jgi:hypothetical protein
MCETEEGLGFPLITAAKVRGIPLDAWDTSLN